MTPTNRHPRSRSIFVLVLVLALVCGHAPGRASEPGPAPEPAEPKGVEATGVEGRPNLLVVTIDTLRRDHVSSYGYPWPTTPNLDELAAEGVLFERAYAPIPVTGPSHATLMTGLLPQTHGAYRNGVRMNEKAVTLAEILDGLGYRTAAFVSGWTLRSNLTGLDKGFDVYDETFTDRYAMVNSQRPANEVSNAALGWLEENADSSDPFFLWVHYFDPHEPYELIRGFDELPVRSEAAPSREKKIVRYDSEVAFADAHMGRILLALEKRDSLEDTIVVVTSDHGEAFGEHGYEGHGRRVHEPGIQVPLVVRWPQRFERGRRVDQLVGLIDLAPTLLEALGAEPLDAQQGISLVPWLDPGTTPPPVSRRLHAVAYPGTVGHMPKWVRRIFTRKKPDLPLQMAVLWDGWKYVLLPRKDKARLYDLLDDPGEEENVLGEHPEMESMTARLEDWFRATRDEEGETALTAEDAEHLESLGYTGAAKAAGR